MTKARALEQVTRWPQGQSQVPPWLHHTEIHRGSQYLALGVFGPGGLSGNSCVQPRPHTSVCWGRGRAPAASGWRLLQAPSSLLLHTSAFPLFGHLKR